MKYLLLHAIKAAIVVSVLVPVFAFCVYGQSAGQVEVTRNVKLRHDPSAANDPITLLKPPVRLDLIEADKTNGYYHVRDEDADEGWVWGSNVRVLTPSEIEALTQPTAASGSPADQISSGWAKPTPKNTTFNGKEGTCTFNGNDGSDPDQYMLKNRADVPTSYHLVSWEAIDGLPFPGKDDHQYAPLHRVDWVADQLAVITPFEGIPVTVIGYIVAIKPQNTGTGEGTNCHFHLMGDVDTHLALVENVGDAEKSSVVIEWTPRLAKAHPNWTRTKMMPWLDSDSPVRVSGFLMVDPDHVGHLGKFRNTLWEVHPITKFEVFQNGQWVDMDNLP